MKFLIFILLFGSQLALANNSIQGKGDDIFSAKLNAIQQSMVKCSGASRIIGSWRIEEKNVSPTCPDAFDDEAFCITFVSAKAKFECL